MFRVILRHFYCLFGVCRVAVAVITAYRHFSILLGSAEVDTPVVTAQIYPHNSLQACASLKKR
jgi:hypothetical protein